MKTITKALAGTIAAGAMVIGSAAPAFAQDRYGDRDRGIDAGDVIAGALVIGGIAAVAAAASNDSRDYRDRDYRNRDYRDRNWDGRGSGWYDYRSGYRYGRGNSNPERAVQRCVQAAERQAERWGGGRADVTRINNVDRERGGFEVTGRIAVNNGYNRGWNNRDRRDTGRFYCEYRGGRVVDIDFDGLGRR
jgi:hypothetical protein